MKRQVVARAGDVAPGQCKIVNVAGREIGVFNVDGRYFALANRCPHEGYPLVEGNIAGGCVLTCNWHNWKFDLESGETLIGGDRLRRAGHRVTGWLPEIRDDHAVEPSGWSLVYDPETGKEVGRTLPESITYDQWDMLSPEQQRRYRSMSQSVGIEGAIGQGYVDGSPPSFSAYPGQVAAATETVATPALRARGLEFLVLVASLYFDR